MILGVRRTATLGDFVDEHLEGKEAEDLSDKWLQQDQTQLGVAIEFFGEERGLSTIRVGDVREYVEYLGTLPGRGGTFSGGTIRHYLNSLGNLFRRAVAEEVVTHNPVAALLHKPTADRQEADWLEVDEATRLLEETSNYGPTPECGAAEFMYPLVATFLLTGGRKSEVLGLRVNDVSFDRKTVTFRPNPYRRLKTRTSHRTIPLWPQLELILRDYVAKHQPRDLLFPSPRANGHDTMQRDHRKQLDAIGKKAGFEKGRIRTKMFRHTYTSARLQTLDNGAPVALFTVAWELGHSSTMMVERVYSHLGRVRHRSEVVEFVARAEDTQAGGGVTA